MGLGSNKNASESYFPTGTTSELREMGIDVSKVHSCAIPDDAGGVRGCPHALRCAKFFSNPRVGGFGPKGTKPGTEGQGPENVPYHIETAEGDEKEDFQVCHMFMGGLFKRMLASRVPDDLTGEVSGERIRILGVAGKTQIVTYETLPVEPKLCNKTGNITMKTTELVQLVPKHPRPKDLDPRWRERKARAAADTDAVIDDLIEESVVADMADDAVATPVPVGGGSSDTTATAEPIRRRSNKP